MKIASYELVTFVFCSVFCVDFSSTRNFITLLYSKDINIKTGKYQPKKVLALYI